MFLFKKKNFFQIIFCFLLSQLQTNNKIKLSRSKIEIVEKIIIFFINDYYLLEFR